MEVLGIKVLDDIIFDYCNYRPIAKYIMSKYLHLLSGNGHMSEDLSGFDMDTIIEDVTPAIEQILLKLKGVRELKPIAAEIANIRNSLYKEPWRGPNQIDINNSNWSWQDESMARLITLRESEFIWNPLKYVACWFMQDNNFRCDKHGIACFVASRGVCGPRGSHAADNNNPCFCVLHRSQFIKAKYLKKS